MASTTILRRPPPGIPTPRRPDEDLINRSLLDNIDAQADAEPMLSSDSEASGAKSTGTNGSITSPPPSFATSAMQSQLSRSDSPSLLPQRTQPHHGIDSYIQHSQNTAQPMYNTMHHPSDFQTNVHDNATPKQFEKANFTATSARTPTGFNTFANARPRHSVAAGLPTFRESFPTYANSAESFGSAQTAGPTQSFDPRYEFGSPPASAPVPGVAHKSSFNSLDPFAPPPMVQAPPQGKTGTTTGPRQRAGYHAPTQAAFAGPLSAMHSQTPFGPHLSVGGAATLGNAGMGPVSAAVQNATQEEISTIFVVGFPDDMQEREFQNMFTFSPGFEAATLKIPNKELTSYGPGAGNVRSGGFTYSGSNDPYNLVTVNQGGVLVDNGRDGTTTSWGSGLPHEDGHFSNGPNVAPRKQIIGFAKFRSRQEALDAREVLQGRRVDAEKGAVLKAEMAKKNLHTKRGVGQAGVPTMNGLGDGIPGVAGANGLGSLAPGADALNARERELNALGAMGFAAFSPRSRTLHEQDIERGPPGLLPMQGVLGTRGPRERAEEDERQREHRRREKEQRLRNTNSTAFDAFHSIPQQMVRNAPVNPLLEEDSYASAGFAMGRVAAQEQNRMRADPWSRDGLAPNAPIRKVPSSLSSASFALRQADSQQGSPTNFDEFPSGPNSTSSQDGFDSDVHSNPDIPAFGDHSRGMFMQHGFRPRAASPQADHGHTYHVGGHIHSSASSTSGSSQIGQDDVVGTMAALSLANIQGEVSPQMPSPISNASSGSAPKGNVDQNPPINTLYVGNLPTSLVGAYPNQLEEMLKALFSRCQGFRKLCFRQKANGPMCFVEFEDVSFATKALNDLYGHTLDGMIKNGGIRLSYSKNPLGVRTPTTATGPNQPPHGMPNDLSPFLPDSFQPRQQAHTIEHEHQPRRDSTVTSPTTAYHHYSLSPPPPRFFAPSPGATFASPNMHMSSTSFPRANPQGYSLPSPPSSGASPFSSFGLPSGRAPDQPTFTDGSDNISRTLPPLTT